jgi:hypothetical protein
MKAPALMMLVVVTLGTTTFAQHADVRPYVENGRILTAGFVDSTSTVLPNLRVFGYDFGEDPGQPYFAQDPGFNSSADSGLPSGSQLLFNIVSAGSLGLPANLTYWNGVGDVAFSATPADESLALNLGSQNRVANDSTSFVAGFSLQTVGATGTIHRHLNAFLNGGTPTAGIYLLSLEFESSDRSIVKSLPFFLLYNNGLGEDAHDQAIEWVQQNLVVPEPVSLLPVGIACCAATLRLRHPIRSDTYRQRGAVGLR